MQTEQTHGGHNNMDHFNSYLTYFERDQRGTQCGYGTQQPSWPALPNDLRDGKRGRPVKESASQIRQQKKRFCTLQTHTS